MLSIGNRKSSGFFLASFARALKRASLIALSKLPSRAALKRTLIRTQTCAPIDGQDALDLSMWPRNYVNTYQFADPSCRRCSGVGGCLHGTHVSPHEDRHVTGADILFSQELNIRSFDHRVSGFDGSDEAFGLHHSECF
jgi:hypothetical protein